MYLCLHMLACTCMSMQMYIVYSNHPAHTLLIVLACTQLSNRCVRACKAWAHTMAIANNTHNGNSKQHPHLHCSCTLLPNHAFLLFLKLACHAGLVPCCAVLIHAACCAQPQIRMCNLAKLSMLTRTMPHVLLVTADIACACYCIVTSFDC